MGRIIRRNEINRRRARHEKLVLLKRRFQEANNDKTKQKLMETLERVAPWLGAESYLGKQ